MGRRDYGSGSIRQNTARGRWEGTIELGWTERGTRKRKTVTGPTKRAVQIKLRELRNSDQVLTRGGRPTVKTWADRWLEITSSELRPTAWQANRSQVVRWIVPTIGHRRLDQLTPGDRRSITTAMTRAGLASSSVTRAQAVLGKMLKDAIIEGHAVPQSVMLVKTGGGSVESGRDAIPLDDALLILAVASERPDSSRWAAAMMQGMRPAECLGLTWDAVDLDAGTLDVSWQLKSLRYRVARDRSSGFRVPNGYIAKQVDGSLHLTRPKTQAGRRVIPLVPWMSAALAAWRELAPDSRAGLVWPREDGRPQTDDADRAAWRDLCDKAQVASVEGREGRRYALYEARHTTATLLRQAGVDDETIKAIMGHASILSTKAYLHTDSARARAALQQVADRLALK